MRFIIVALVCACFLGLFVGCCGPGPTLTLRNPVLIDQELPSAAGPRLIQQPAYFAPSYAPVAAPAMPAGYAAAPCTP